MQTCPEPCVDNLVTKIVRHFEVAYGVQVAGRPGCVEAVDVEIEVLRAEEAAEHLDHRRGNRTMGRGIFGMVRGYQERSPTQLLDCHWVTIVIPGEGAETINCDCRRVDGRDWAP